MEMTVHSYSSVSPFKLVDIRKGLMFYSAKAEKVCVCVFACKVSRWHSVLVGISNLGFAHEILRH